MLVSCCYRIYLQVGDCRPGTEKRRGGSLCAVSSHLTYNCWDWLLRYFFCKSFSIWVSQKIWIKVNTTILGSKPTAMSYLSVVLLATPTAPSPLLATPTFPTLFSVDGPFACSAVTSDSRKLLSMSSRSSSEHVICKGPLGFRGCDKGGVVMVTGGGESGVPAGVKPCRRRERRDGSGTSESFLFFGLNCTSFFPPWKFFFA